MDTHRKAVFSFGMYRSIHQSKKDRYLDSYGPATTSATSSLATARLDSQTAGSLRLQRALKNALVRDVAPQSLIDSIRLAIRQ